VCKIITVLCSLQMLRRFVSSFLNYQVHSYKRKECEGMFTVRVFHCSCRILNKVLKGFLRFIDAQGNSKWPMNASVLYAYYAVVGCMANQQFVANAIMLGLPNTLS
jgi:hypothetical protein